MYAWYIAPGDRKTQLQKREVEQPQAGSKQVLVKIRAASLNHRDLYMLDRATAATSPVIPLSDAAGEVQALGEGSTRFSVGDRVLLPFFPRWFDGPPREEVLPARGEPGTPGVLVDYVVAEERELLALPEHLTYAEGATLPCAGVTAWNALSTGNLQAGETVLALGTGGVSIFGIQFAKAAGARTIVTSRSEEKLQKARALGADETIHTTTYSQWDEQVGVLTGGRGVDHVLEVGGADTIALSLHSIRLGGHVDLIGGLGGFTGSVDLGDLRSRLGVVQTFYVGNLATFTAMNDFITQHRIHPVIDRTFSFEEAPAAFEYLAGGSHIGKVVIEW
jgi:NADPH:quinone reductase-like Zn-dependent oxidoreductase